MHPLENEIWKDIIGYEKSYSISSLGRILAKEKRVLGSHGVYKLHKEKFLKLSIHTGGYNQLWLWRNKKIQGFSFHRIFATHFIPNPENKPFINHKDGNKLNNSISNLEWCTSSDNLIHAYSTGLKSAKGEKHGRRKLTNSIVLKIREMYSVKKDLECLSDLFKVSKSTICSIGKRKTWQHI